MTSGASTVEGDRPLVAVAVAETMGLTRGEPGRLLFPLC